MKIYLLILLILTAVFAYPVEITLTHQRSIGDDADDDYTFFRIKGAVITDKKEIIVSDDKGVFVAKYSWDGKFIKRVGRKGRGPGDFISMRGLTLFKNKLYIFDGNNRRIAITDTDLSEFEYVKTYPLTEGGDSVFELPSWIYVLGSGKYLAQKSYIKKVDESLFLLDDNRQVGKRFFKELPIAGEKLEETTMLSYYLNPKVGVDITAGRLLVACRFPGNEIKFHQYNLAGETINEFNYKQNELFQFPTAIVNKKNKKSDRFNFSVIGSIHNYKGFYLVFFTEFRDIQELAYDPEILKKAKNCVLVFDKKGNFLTRARIDNNLHIYHISPDGDVLAIDEEQELFGESQKLLIYKLAIK